MAVRPVFLVENLECALVATEDVNFQWHPGLAMSQRRLSARSLAEKVKAQFPEKNILEVSRMSESVLGTKLSAFNLLYPEGRETAGRPVECVFQSAKVFREGGPFRDLLKKPPKDAKTDNRLKTSGPLIGFDLEGQKWPTQPLTAFYDWIYLKSLHADAHLAEAVMQFDAFTDIAFNPAKSFSCQAFTVALYVSLKKKGRIDEVLRSPDEFLSFLGQHQVVRNEASGQSTLGL